jgi:hypothetical protein
LASAAVTISSIDWHRQQWDQISSSIGIGSTAVTISID